VEPDIHKPDVFVSEPEAAIFSKQVSEFFKVKDSFQAFQIVLFFGALLQSYIYLTGADLGSFFFLLPFNLVAIPYCIAVPFIFEKLNLTDRIKASFIFIVVVLPIAQGTYDFYRGLRGEPMEDTQVEIIQIEQPVSGISLYTYEKTDNAGEWNFYSVSYDKAFYQNEVIDGADVSTFQEISDRWAKDKNFVYREGKVQPYLDPETVRVFPHVYVTDKMAVWVYATNYYMTVDKTDADPLTFSVISHGYGKDKNSVYYFAKKIINADPRTFTLFRGPDYPSMEGLASNWYAKDINNVYYRSSVITGADTKSFVYLGYEYAKDNNLVYYQGKALSSAKVESFSLVDEGYAKDRQHVFYEGKIANIEIDPAFFVVVGGGAIKDANRVYFRNSYNNSYDLANGVNASTFRYIGKCESFEMSVGSYFVDKNNVYTQKFFGRNPVAPVISADVASFYYFGVYEGENEVPYSVSYAKDKNNVYHSCGELLDGADSGTFVDLKDGYVKDRSRVWYLAKEVTGADATTFQSLGNGYAKDASRKYFGGFVIENVGTRSF
jgi:hypothetical protein